jgi:DNA-binding GntR family transcriptional regulator
VTPQQAVSNPPSPEALDAPIRQWQRSNASASAVAAGLAQAIRSGEPPAWHELAPLADLADQYGVSYRTVTRAKQILPDAGILRADSNRYVVAPPAAATATSGGTRG